MIESKTLSDLKQLREEWLEQNDPDENELEWNQRGVEIHRALLVYEPRNVEYRYTLARLLVDLAVDLKKRIVNYSEAKRFLKEAIRVEPRSKRSKYYMGIIFTIEKQWELALEYLNFDINNSGIMPIEKVRAYCAIAVCQKMIGNSQEAEQALKRAKELNDNSASRDIEYFNAILYGIIPDPPRGENSNNDHDFYIERYDKDLVKLVLMTKDESKIITKSEASNVYISDEECLLLDLRPQFSYAEKNSPPKKRHACLLKILSTEDSVELQPKEAELLAFLLLNEKPKSSKIIKENLWEESQNTHVVKSYIKKLRDKLQVLYSEDMEKIIAFDSNSGGYIWRDNRPFKIISLQGLYKSFL